MHGEAELRFLGQNLKKVPGGRGPPQAPTGPTASPGCSLPGFFHPLLEGHYPGTAGVMMGLVRWQQVPVPGCRLGAQQGDAFCHGASCRGAARSPCQGWPWLSPRTHGPCRALTCPLWVCSSPGARSSTGGLGCTPTRTTGGSSKSETEPPRPCVSPCHCPRLPEHCGSAASRGFHPRVLGWRFLTQERAVVGHAPPS